MCDSSWQGIDQHDLAGVWGRPPILAGSCRCRGISTDVVHAQHGIRRPRASPRTQHASTSATRLSQRRSQCRQVLNSSHSRELRQQTWYEVSPATICPLSHVLDLRKNRTGGPQSDQQLVKILPFPTNRFPNGSGKVGARADGDLPEVVGFGS